MNTLLATQLREVIAPAETRPALRCESQLRVAAQMLSNAQPDEIGATTVVGVLGSDDVPAFEALVAEIADELDLDARVRLHVGSFSVRLSRRPTPAPEPRRQQRPDQPTGNLRFTLRSLVRNRQLPLSWLHTMLRTVAAVSGRRELAERVRSNEFLTSPDANVEGFLTPRG